MKLYPLHRFVLRKMALLAFLFSYGLTFSQNTGKAASDLAKANQLNQEQSLVFTENKGQVTDNDGNSRPDILFSARMGHTRLFLSQKGIHYQFQKNVFSKKDKRKKINGQNEIPEIEKSETYHFSIELQNTRSDATILKEEKNAYTENFYTAAHPEGIIGVGTYNRIVYKNIYPFIDWVVYANGQYLKYDFVVHPGGDASQIKLKINDAKNVRLNKEGDMVIKTALGTVTEEAPVSFVGGKPVKSSFVLFPGNLLGYAVENYDKSKALTIDPYVSWATYYGGNGTDNGYSVAVSDSGFVYLAGRTNSSSNIASGGYQNSIAGNGYDAYLVKFHPGGGRLWATYYGGAGTSVEYGQSVAVSDSGFVYLAGYTSSSSGIASSGAFQATFGGNYDAFLVKFNPGGRRLWATYYGGSDGDYGQSVTVSDSGFVYLTGQTYSSSGIASGGFQSARSGTNDAFLVKFKPDGNRLWATYYGGSSTEYGYSVAVSDSGFVYLAGYTRTGSGTGTGIASPGAFQTTYGGSNDAFLVKFHPGGGRLWATYYGGSADEYAYSVAVNDSGFVYLAGYTSSSSGIASPGAFQTSFGGYTDAYLVKFHPGGGRLWATYYGGSGYEYGYSVAVSDSGFVYLTGYATSSSGIASGGFQNTIGGAYDACLVKFNPGGNRLWASYYGGPDVELGQSVAVSDSGFVYLTGYTVSSSGIASSGAFQDTLAGSYDAYLIKIHDGPINWNGSVSTAWNTPANWTPAVVPAANDNVLIPGSLPYYPVVSTGITATCYNIDIKPLASLTVNGGTLQLYGHVIYNNGTFTNPSGTIEMKGISKQTIYPNKFTANQVNNFTINNPAGVELATALKVGGVLKRTLGVLTTNDSLVLSAASSHSYGQIDATGADSVVGNATVQKVMANTLAGWRQVSIPVDAAVSSFEGIGVLTNAHTPAGQRNIYRWDATDAGSGIAKGYVEASYTDGDSSAYVVYSNNANTGLHELDTIISIFGKPNNGDYTISLPNTYDPLNATQTSSSQGWSLVPNRYPSNIDVSALVYDVSFQPAYKAVHVWDFINQQYVGLNGSGLINYNTGGGAKGTGNDIAPFQAFWVKANTSGQSIMVKNSHRTTKMDSVTIFQKSGPGYLRLTIKDNDGFRDQVAVGFDPMATTGLDGTMDIYKIKTMSMDVPTLYISEQNLDLSVDMLPSYDNKIVQLMLSSQKDNHSYTFSADLDNLDMGTEVFLVDKKTGKVSDLRQGDIGVTYSKADDKDRYFLRFSRSSAAIQNIGNLEKAYVSADGEGIKVWYLNAGSAEGVDIEAYNMQGQLVYAQDQIRSGENIKFKAHEEARQMYILHIRNNYETKTFKIIY